MTVIYVISGVLLYLLGGLTTCYSVARMSKRNSHEPDPDAVFWLFFWPFAVCVGLGIGVVYLGERVATMGMNHSNERRAQRHALTKALARERLLREEAEAEVEWLLCRTKEVK